MKSWAVFLSLAVPMLIWPKFAAWFVWCCVCLAVIFGAVAIIRGNPSAQSGDRT